MDRNRLSVSSDSLFKELAFNSCKTLNIKLNKIYCQYYLLSAALLFVDSISAHMRSVESIALMTIIFAFILYFADTKNKDTISELKSISIFTIVFIGFMQTLAIMPGVSRAGIVITAALFANFSREDSIKIAFLLSIPAIFMATVYQSMQLYEIGNIEILNEHLLGMFLSFIFSYITIHLFISTINKISFTPYIIYRLILGIVLIGFI